ncbi:MAG: glycosyl transferase family 2 [Solirubrobacterales bacterium]|nr:glycosyl transferase family 2 [Solirubrobacterales bacterium]
MRGAHPYHWPRMQAPDVSVLVPIRNEASIIRESSRTIVGQLFDGSAEFLMIDGNSQDGTRAVLDELAGQDPRVRVLENPAGDLASALNVGLAAARGEFVAKMDAHTYFPTSYLQAGVDRLRRGGVSWVSGPQIPRGSDPWSRRVALALGTRLGMGGSAKWGSASGAGEPEEKELDTGVFSGVWRRSVLERLGGWDPDWPVNEDSELASRFLETGERILCLRSMGAHYVPRSSVRGLARQYYRYGYYRAKTANRHPASMRNSHLGPPTIILVCVAGVLGGRRSRALAGLSLAAYALIQAAESIRATRDGDHREAPLLPIVYTTMHMSFGAGYIAGCLRFGIPHDALKLRLGR